MNMTTLKPNRSSGFLLIEVLVALLVSSVGIMGMIALQGQAQSAQMDVYQRAQAMLLIEEMTNRISANSNAALCYDNLEISQGSALPASCPTTVHSDSEAIFLNDLAAWQALLSGATETAGGVNVGGLRDAVGCLEEDGGVLTVSVSWYSPTAHVAAPGNTCGVGATAQERRRVMSVNLEFAG